MSDTNKVLSITTEMIAQESVPQAILVGQNKICQTYQYDLATSFIRLDAELFCIPLFVCGYQKEPKTVEKEQNVDFTKSYYQHKEEVLVDFEEDTFIHTTNFSLYQSKLESLGYIPHLDKEISEACISFVKGQDAGVLGFFVFERYEGSKYLTVQEIEETKALLLIMATKVENFETKKQLKEEENKSIFDKLTGLPVLREFKKEARKLLELEDKYAIIYLDIDKFKYINDIWSRETGDDILKSLAHVIQKNIGDKECCCRVEDDKFVAMIRYETQQELEDKIDSVNVQFKQMQQEKFCDVKITVIGGIYKIGVEKNIDLLMDKANIARTSSKGTYDNTCTIYDQDLESLNAREKQLENRAAYALEHHEFIPFLQPKFDIRTNQICGAEALARWKIGDSMISPIEFIGLFEKNGFITRMDFAIYEATLTFMQQLLQKGHQLVPISMNVSRGHMKDTTFCNRFLKLLEKYQVPCNLIELEVTESVFMDDKDIITNFIKELRDHGIMVSIDDFGTEYSSLNLLKDLVVDTIKLDKSFIDDLLVDKDVQKNKVIIKNIVTMIRELGFDIIFEGVESVQQVDFLKEINCYTAQGFLFSRPIPLAAFEKEYYK
ncbi:putative bifunctional diguanylate cyclase/phosphodiesterase [Tannockella kyphosi]|uniref:putative bifunctional diguanylate cyclase/phosphodiesterase n=1 Tax=Tannockella kyphosi TaxID=2899121 RepID=UPI00201399CD|nr:bifunctional diguanylate cyclase/phosphodiesterase [Tannockella kyphosi]